MARIGQVKSLAFAMMLLAVAACTTQYRNHGYVPTDDELSEIRLGVDTRDSVTEALGTPTAGGVLDDSGFYYVRSKVKHFGARRPEVVERQLVAISFNNRGVVEGVQRFSLQDGLVVPLSKRVTDNGLENENFLKQMLQNLGNFDAGSFFS
ncbi:outer membrane protein assembly factor BamE [Shimia biformata]|uniref:outer membrane protein assembly factor BamE n=1 Tax=Shimia biformata TaxID=1294299 RepID=UPI0019520053|nr:outer membrane protein assembly factor BamE [Shimia biformata]